MDEPLSHGVKAVAGDRENISGAAFQEITGIVQSSVSSRRRQNRTKFLEKS
jgi:hypothetical protein